MSGQGPEVTEPFLLNGKGWWSPELSGLRRDFGASLVRQACDELQVDPRPQNVDRLRGFLERWEARMK
jgi:hypothetical protein